MNYHPQAFAVGGPRGAGARSRPTGNPAVDAAIAARDAAQAELASERRKTYKGGGRTPVFTSEFADYFNPCEGAPPGTAVETVRSQRWKVKNGQAVLDKGNYLCRLMAGQTAVNVGPGGKLHVGPGKAPGRWGSINRGGGVAVNPDIFTAGGWSDALNALPGVLYVRGADDASSWFKKHWLTLLNTGILVWLLIAGLTRK